ncbi:MAG TPA: CocE/NonD family hydrolase, partial [Minicystis sp.]|nr:CocE/NonD family hydrolase [Minicystis sp.]
MSDAHWMPGRQAQPIAKAPKPRSLYLTMRDGVRIAIDVYAPLRAERAPTVLRQTRYFRSLEATPALAWSGLTKQFDLYERTRRVFLAAGYAWVDVDVRGTGASTGAWPYPWSPAEVADGVEVVDWIVRQPWSNGRVGALGISYDGTAAEMLLGQHRAVRAILPTYSLYDVYTDVAFPGGIPLLGFLRRWAHFNGSLDAGRFGDAYAQSIWLIARAERASPRGSPLARAFARDERAFARAVSGGLAAVARGVRPVSPGAPSAAELAARSRNMDVHAMAQRIAFRDDAGVLEDLPEGTIDSLSPHARNRDAEPSAAVYSYSGWRDAAYQHGAIKRFLSVRAPGSRLTIGPWAHAGRQRIRPFEPAVPAAFDHDAEHLAFVDAHVRRPEPGATDGDAV